MLSLKPAISWHLPGGVSMVLERCSHLCRPGHGVYVRAPRMDSVALTLSRRCVNLVFGQTDVQYRRGWQCWYGVCASDAAVVHRSPQT
jgi:hypothetical protein